MFSQLDENTKLRLCTIPRCVSVTDNFDDEKFEQIAQRQNKFLRLPQDIKNKLSSEETSQIIQSIGKIFNLDLLQMASVSRLVRGFYFDEIKFESIVVLLSEKLKIDDSKARAIFEHLKKNLFTEKPQEKNSIGSAVKLPLSAALQKYPEIREQIITEASIKLEPFTNPAMPSLKNWLADYRQKAGAERHSAIERGNYLFQSENGRKLSYEDRQKLGEIFKSLEEGSLLEIDVAEKKIVFAAAPAPRAFVRSNSFVQNNFVRNDNVANNPSRAESRQAIIPRRAPNPNFNQRPEVKNLVNLKENF